MNTEAEHASDQNLNLSQSWWNLILLLSCLLMWSCLNSLYKWRWFDLNLKLSHSHNSLHKVFKTRLTKANQKASVNSFSVLTITVNITWPMTNIAIPITLESLITADVKQVQLVFPHFHVPGFQTGACRVNLFLVTTIAEPNKSKIWIAFNFLTEWVSVTQTLSGDV